MMKMMEIKQSQLQQLSITSTADSNYDSLADQTFTTAVVDNDTVGYVITESGGSTSVTEGGSSDSISVVLSSQPNTKVRITFTSADLEVTVSSSAFSNWDTPQNLSSHG